jgi:hypothetical protein
MRSGREDAMGDAQGRHGLRRRPDTGATRIASVISLASVVIGLALIAVATARAVSETRAAGTTTSALGASTGESTATASGSPAPASTTSPSTTPVATAPPSPTAVDPADPTAQAAACAAIPTGTVPSFLDVTGVTAGTEVDPRTQVATREVTATLRTSAVGVTQPFSIVIAVLRVGSTEEAGSTRPLDRAGDEQLAVGFDGSHLHKGVRTLAGGTWTLRADTAASDLSYRIDDSGATLFFTGLRPGDRVGVVTAAAAACQSKGLDAQLAPQKTVP